MWPAHSRKNSLRWPGMRVGWAPARRELLESRRSTSLKNSRQRQPSSSQFGRERNKLDYWGGVLVRTNWCRKCARPESIVWTMRWVNSLFFVGRRSFTTQRAGGAAGPRQVLRPGKGRSDCPPERNSLVLLVGTRGRIRVLLRSPVYGRPTDEEGF